VVCPRWPGQRALPLRLVSRNSMAYFRICKLNQTTPTRVVEKKDGNWRQRWDCSVSPQVTSQQPRSCGSDIGHLSGRLMSGTRCRMNKAIPQRRTLSLTVSAKERFALCTVGRVPESRERS
jgi:hypothetical protein